MHVEQLLSTNVCCRINFHYNIQTIRDRIAILKQQGSLSENSKISQAKSNVVSSFLFQSVVKIDEDYKQRKISCTSTLRCLSISFRHCLDVGNSSRKRNFTSPSAIKRYRFAERLDIDSLAGITSSPRISPTAFTRT